MVAQHSHGDAASMQYTLKIRGFTVRHAMLSQLKSPPAVLRYAVLAHFCSKRGALKEPVRGWVADGKVAVAGASGSTDAGGVATLFASLDRSATEFAAALDSMENPVASSDVSGSGQQPLETELWCTSARFNIEMITVHAAQPVL